MARGNPPIPVRASDEAKAPWRAAAEREGLTLSAWVHRALNAAAGITPGGHARVPTTDQPVSELSSNTLAARTAAPVARLQAEAQAAAQGDCPHPRERRQRQSYGTICGACGRVVGPR